MVPTIREVRGGNLEGEKADLAAALGETAQDVRIVASLRRPVPDGLSDSLAQALTQLHPSQTTTLGLVSCGTHLVSTGSWSELPWSSGTNVCAIGPDQVEAACMTAILPDATCGVSRPSGTDVITPESVQVLIASLPADNPSAELKRTLRSLAPGGIAIVLAPSTMLDGEDRAALHDITRSHSPITGSSIVRCGLPGLTATPLSDVLLLTTGSEADRGIPGDMGWDSTRRIPTPDDIESYSELTARVSSNISEFLGDKGIDDASHPASPASVIEDPTNEVRGAKYKVDRSGSTWIVSASGAAWLAQDATRRPASARRLAGMVRLGDLCSLVQSLEADPSVSETELRETRENLKAEYDRFVQSNGRISKNANRRLLDNTIPESYVITSLEERDELGNFVAEADVLTTRTIDAVIEPEAGSLSAEQALLACLDQVGHLDLALVARLMGTSIDEAVDGLEGLVVRDLTSDEEPYVLADEFLSGNLQTKIDAIDGKISEIEGQGLRSQAWRLRREAGILQPGEAITDTDNLRPGYSAAITGILTSEAWHSVTAEDAGVVYPSRVLGDMCAEVYDRDMYYYELRGFWAALTHKLSQDMQPGTLSNVLASRKFLQSLVGHQQSLGRPGGWIHPLHDVEDQYESDPSSVDITAVQDEILAQLPEAIFASLTRMAAKLPAGDADVLATTLSKSCKNEYLETAALVMELPPAPKSHWLEPESVEWRKSTLNALFKHPSCADAILISVQRRIRAIDPHYLVHGLRGWNPRIVNPEEIKTIKEDLDAWDAQLKAADVIDEPQASRLNELKRLRERLVSALPERVEKDDISIRMGAPWVRPHHIMEFLEEKILDQHLTPSVAKAVVVCHDDATRSWTFRTNRNSVSTEAEMRYETSAEGCNTVGALDLVEQELKGSPTRVTRSVDDGRGGVRYVTDEELTLTAREKRVALAREFEEWAWGDPTRAEQLVDAYNRTFNCYRNRTWDGSHLTLPGSSSIALQPHQKTALARCLGTDTGTLLAHEVGAGKTFEGIAAAHEKKRIGQATKTLVTCPNSVIEQWANEWHRLYPNDSVLVMGASATSSRTSTRRFWELARDGEWDAVIVGHARFDALELSADRLNELAQEADRRAAELRGETQGRSLAGSRRRYATQLESGARDLRARAARVTEEITFDDCGFDALIVDEAHNYKHLGVSSRMNVSGVDNTTSKKCTALLEKCEWLRSQGHGANIMFLTGTPLTNSVCELYVMQRYLDPDGLEERGIADFDSWAAQYGKVTREVELRPEGGLQTKERFSRFVNLPELMGEVREWCDVVTNDDLDIDVRGVEVINVDVPPTDAQRMCMRWLEGRGNTLRHEHVDPHDDNMLLITNDGKKVALDPKLIFPDDPNILPMQGGKVEKCVREVTDIYRQTTSSPDGDDVRGTQIVFCDSSCETGSGQWNVQTDVKRRLVDAGIPEEEIAIVSGSLSASRRENIFAAARDGRIRVLIGSTSTLGTGVSIQNRLAATHDLDCPWRASDLAQRLGRIQRQGNMFARCNWFRPRCMRYATTGTFDAFLYSTTSRKGSFTAQVMTNANPAREAAEISDVVLTLDEMKALSSGNPAVRRRLELENEVKALQYKKNGWLRERDRKEEKLQEVKDSDTRVLWMPEISGLDAKAAALEAISDSLRSAALAARSFPNRANDGVTIPEAHAMGLRVDDSNDRLSEANRRLTQAMMESGHNGTISVGNILGVEVGVRMAPVPDEPFWSPHPAIQTPYGEIVLTKVVHSDSIDLGTRVKGPVDSIIDLLSTADAALNRAQRQVARAQAQVASIEESLAQPWSLADELLRAQVELDALPPEDCEMEHTGTAPKLRDVHEFLVSGNVMDVGRREELPPPAEEPDEIEVPA